LTDIKVRLPATAKEDDMAKGYIYAEVEITDPAEYEKYRPLAAASIEAFGGRYVVRRGDPEVLEGGRPVRLAVVLEFPTRERAREWYTSPQYDEAKAFRFRGANTHLILLSGYDAG
jgi:uncharacterized protein (DUF1330 family)